MRQEYHQNETMELVPLFYFGIINRFEVNLGYMYRCNLRIIQTC